MPGRSYPRYRHSTGYRLDDSAAACETRRSSAALQRHLFSVTFGLVIFGKSESEKAETCMLVINGSQQQCNCALDQTYNTRNLHVMGMMAIWSYSNRLTGRLPYAPETNNHVCSPWAVAFGHMRRTVYYRTMTSKLVKSGALGSRSLGDVQRVNHHILPNPSGGVPKYTVTAW